MKKIFALFLLFLLAGCQTKQAFPAPVNLRIENEVLLWDAEGAALFYLKLNGIIHTLEVSSFALETLEAGEYECQVMAAKTGYYNSAYSEVFSFLWTDKAIPLNLRIDEGNLQWDECANATGYLVLAGDEEYQVNTNSFDLSILSPNRTYYLRVRAIYPHQVSASTETIVYHAFPFYQEYELYYNKNNDTDFSYDFSAEDFLLQSLLTADLEELAGEVYQIEQNQLTIKREYLNYGQYIFVGLTSKGKIIINLVVGDDRLPEQVEAELVFDGEDLEIVFLLYDYEIIKVEGNEITRADYQISGNRIIINQDYLNRKFAEAGRNTLILACQFSADQKHHLDYLFITKISG
jgi:hypothetical protein